MDSPVNLVPEDLSDPEGHPGHLGSQVLRVWMEFKGQRATWGHLERQGPAVNKEILDYRAFLVLRVPSACQERRVPRGTVGCRDSLVSMALLAIQEEKALQERRGSMVCLEPKGLLVIQGLAVSRGLME